MTGASHGIGRADRGPARARGRDRAARRALGGRCWRSWPSELRADGGDAYALPADLSRRGRARCPRWRSGSSPSTAARRRRQQRRQVDPPRDRPLLRPLPRLHAHRPTSTTSARCGCCSRCCRRCASAAAATSSTSRRSACCCRRRRAGRPTRRRRPRSTRGCAPSPPRSHADGVTAHVALHGARPHAHERADRRLQARARPHARRGRRARVPRDRRPPVRDRAVVGDRRRACSTSPRAVRATGSCGSTRAASRRGRAVPGGAAVRAATDGAR